jgi:hypothetical protein
MEYNRDELLTYLLGKVITQEAHMKIMYDLLLNHIAGSNNDVREELSKSFVPLLQEYRTREALDNRFLKSGFDALLADLINPPG